MTEGLIGAAVGVLTIVVARLLRGERWFYAVGLVTLPSLYASFALHARQPAVGVREMLYGVPFLVAGVLFARVGFRRSAVVVGALWILHGLYDLAHDRWIANDGVPGWYPVFCCVVDVVVGAYVLRLSLRLPDANLQRA